MSSDHPRRASVGVMMTAVRSEVGQDADLGALHRAHYRALVKLASILVDDRGACEEIVQDAFVSVFRLASRVQDPVKLPAYLRSAVLNGARSQLRKQRVRGRIRIVEAGPAVSAEASALVADEQRAVLTAL